MNFSDYLKAKVLCVLLVILLHLCGTAQGTVDSLLDLSLEYWSRDTDKAYVLAEKAYDISSKAKDRRSMGKARVAKASAKLMQGEYLTAKNLLALNLMDSLSLDGKTLGLTHSFMGYALLNDNFVKANRAFLWAIPHFQKEGDSVNMAIVYNGLGMIQSKLKRETEAQDYYRQSLRYNTDALGYKNLCVYISTQMNMAELYANRSEAESSFVNAVALASKNGLDFFIPTIYQRLGHYYVQNKAYGKAIVYLEKALSETQRMKLGGEEPLLFRDMGTAFFLDGRYGKAVESYYKALPLARMEVRDTLYKRLSMAYYRMNDIENGERYLRRFLEHTDSIRQLHRDEAVTEMIEKYESDRKDLEIKLLQQENQHALFNNRRQKRQLLLAILLASFLTIMVVTVWVFYKREREQNELLYTKNQALVLAGKRRPPSVKAPTGADINKDLVSRIEKGMDGQLFLDKGLTLAKLAHLLGTNTTYLSSTINGHYQSRFSDFINGHRTNYVLSRLETDAEFREYTIDHIADISGFNSSSAFYKAFKKQTGLTPSYYIRRKLREKTNSHS
ncbi:MAG: helix-turn-helix domain-containing protein [Flavobacteriaceae bacterium]